MRIEKFDMNTGEAILTVGEDLDCSGLPFTGETVCNYDEGFLAGILKEYTKKERIRNKKEYLPDTLSFNTMERKISLCPYDCRCDK